MSDLYMHEAHTQWNAARRRLMWSRLLTNVRAGSGTLLDFNEVVHHLRLKNALFRGLQNVPLDKIVGSSGRYRDFTGAFLPVRDNMGERWRRVASLQIDPTRGLPPVELYKVGDWYFVRDGNHRVSVSRSLNRPDIDAYVWEYTEALPDVGPNGNINTWLIEAERLDFLEKTGLDSLRPGHGICVSEPGGYTDIVCWIEHYQSALNQIDETQTSYEDAVTAWYDMIYETSVQIIKQDGVLNLFPQRTAADFFVWMMHHHEQLSEQYGRHIPFRQAIQDFGNHRVLARLTYLIRRLFRR